MAYFTRITSKTSIEKEGLKNAVIMGRNTWFSIPEKYRPLPNRVNCVISRTLTQVPSAAHFLFSSLPDSMASLSLMDDIDKIFVIGGASLYTEALTMNECDKIYVTHIDEHFECDTFMPQVDMSVYHAVTLDDVPTEEQQENGIKFKYAVYQRT